jgi:predicted Kef-type K+ transport protein
MGRVPIDPATAPPPRNATTDPTTRERAAGRVAGILVGVEALVLVGIAVFYLYELLIGEGTDPVVVLMSALTILVFAIGLGYTAKGLLARHPRAQAPAIAFNFLMVPLGIAMFEFAPWWLAGAVLLAGAGSVASTFLMGRLGGD